MASVGVLDAVTLVVNQVLVNLPALDSHVQCSRRQVPDDTN